MKAIYQRFLISAADRLFPRYRRYTGQVLRHRMLRPRSPHPDRAFLFVLCPTFGGSTLVNELIATSAAVSVNNPRGTREGQQLPSVSSLMFDQDQRWDPQVDFDWVRIRQEWEKYWDLRKPVLLEKSPPNLLRASSIEAAFDPAYFLIITRDPFAHAESIIRRLGWSAQAAGDFIVRSWQYQRQNRDSLTRTLHLSYEQLTEQPTATLAQVKEWLPTLGEMKATGTFQAHNYQHKALPVQNLNAAKLAMLRPSDHEALAEVYAPYHELFASFGYQI